LHPVFCLDLRREKEVGGLLLKKRIDTNKNGF